MYHTMADGGNDAGQEWVCKGIYYFSVWLIPLLPLLNININKKTQV